MQRDYRVDAQPRWNKSRIIKFLVNTLMDSCYSMNVGCVKKL